MRHNRKSAICLIRIFLCLIPVAPLPAQINEEDPFDGGYLLGGSSEIFFLSGFPITQEEDTDRRLVSMIVDADSSVAGNGIELTHFAVDTAELGYYGSTSSSGPMDVATADFNLDGNEDVVAVWQGPERSITGFLPHINPATLSWSENSPFSTVGTEWPPLRLHRHDNSRIRLAAGDIDADPEPEFVLAYWADDSSSAGGKVQLLKYDVNAADLTPSVSASNRETSIAPVPSAFHSDFINGWFDMIISDVNNDERNEIVLVSYEPDTLSGATGTYAWQLALRIFDGDLNLLYHSGTDLISGDAGSGPFITRLAIAAADLDGDTINEIAIAYNLMRNAGNLNRTDISAFLQVVRLNGALDGFSQIGSTRQVNSGFHLFDYPLALVAQDLDFDGKADLLHASVTTLGIHRADENLAISDRLAAIELTNGFAGDIYPRIFVAGDMDVLGGDPIAAEIVIEKHIHNGPFVLNVHQIQPDGAGFSTQFVRDWEITAPRGLSPSYAMAMGDFDGDRVRLGTPTRQTQTDIVQPIVILNAPPIHFDVIDGQAYDINRCFDGDCEHRAIYVNTENIQTEVTTTVSADWGISESITGSAGAQLGPFGAHIEHTLERRYGEGFSNLQGSTQEYQITVRTEAIEDDRLYVTKTSYDILEYPVYGKGGLRGHVAAVIPHSISTGRLDNTWLSAKSGDASGFIVQHEVGNVLSYPRSADVPPGATLFGRGNQDSFVLDPQAGSSWFLLFSETDESLRERSAYQQVSRSTTAEISAGYGPFSASLSASVASQYNSEQISTHRTRVTGETSIEVQLGTVDGSILGSDTYEVYPYMYWTQGGTLVLDYAVEPILTSPRVASWWEQTYGQKVDLTFILPWRNDEAKGRGSTNPEVQREETRDIVFSLQNPQPGETVTISTRIYNFSLKDTTATSTARFYLNDPDDGGQLIGEQQFVIPPARESTIVQLQDWQVPADVAEETKIYVVLDSENSIAEVHENNNKSWRLLNDRLDPATGVELTQDAEIPDDFQLHQNYPNPFNPETQIRFELSQSEYVTLHIFNLKGQKVATLLDGEQPAGTHTATWNGRDATGRNVASGIYLYRLQAGEVVAIRKMTVLR